MRSCQTSAPSTRMSCRMCSSAWTRPTKPSSVGLLKVRSPVSPRFHGRNRYHSFTYKEYGNGARLDNGSLVLSKIGRIGGRWSRPVKGAIKTVTISKEAEGWYVSFSCVDVPSEPLPLTGGRPA